MSLFKKTIATVTLAFLTACAEEQIPFQAEGYNKALENFGNKQILMNAVRASERMPMYFSQIGDITVGDTTKAEFDLKFPLTNLALSNIAATPSAKVNTGITNYKLSPLNKKKFIEALHEPVEIKTIAYYLNAGWRPELIANLLIRNIRLASSFVGLIEEKSEEICDAPRSNHQAGLCYEIDRTAALRPQYRPDQFNPNGCEPGPYGEIVNFENHGRDPCQFIPFQNIVRRMLLLGANFVFTSGVKGFDEKGNAKRTEFDSAKIYIPGIGENIGLLREEAEQSAARPGISVRSSQGVIYYLGELIGAEQALPPEYQPSIVIRQTGRPARILVVRQSVPGSVKGISSVHYNGTVYYIPRKNEAGVEHRSSSSLTLAKQLIEAAIEDSDIGKVQTILTTSTD